MRSVSLFDLFSLFPLSSPSLRSGTSESITSISECGRSSTTPTSWSTTVRSSSRRRRLISPPNKSIASVSSPGRALCGVPCSKMTSSSLRSLLALVSSFAHSHSLPLSLPLSLPPDWTKASKPLVSSPRLHSAGLRCPSLLLRALSSECLRSAAHSEEMERKEIKAALCGKATQVKETGEARKGSEQRIVLSEAAAAFSVPQDLLDNL
jgi:hypothetical protein